MPDDSKTRVIIYLRASTEEQTNSIEVQQIACAAYASARALEVVDTLSDLGVSGGVIDRPGLNRAMERINAGEADSLLIYKLDRLSRDTLQCLMFLRDLRDKGITLLSVNDPVDTRTPMGRFMLLVFIGIAEMERDVIIDRTVATLQMKKAKGELVGTVPIGYKVAPDGVRLIVNIVEMKASRFAKKLHAGGRSLRVIAKALAKKGYLSRSGRVYAPQQIKRLVAVDLSKAGFIAEDPPQA